MSGVLVLNAGYEPLHRVSLHHAIRMLAREVAVVEEHVEGATFGPFPVPKVLRLIKYVAMRWRHRRPGWSRQGVFRRDRNICAYCGGKATTIDHIFPRDRGGASTWDNTVACCFDCNHAKANRLLETTGMRLKYATPREPSWHEVAVYAT